MKVLEKIQKLKLQLFLGITRMSVSNSMVIDPRLILILSIQMKPYGGTTAESEGHQGRCAFFSGSRTSEEK